MDEGGLPRRIGSHLNYKRVNTEVSYKVSNSKSWVEQTPVFSSHREKIGDSTKGTSLT